MTTAAFFAAWTLLPPVLAYVTADQLHFFQDRYLLFTVPAWALLTAYGIAQVTRPAHQDPGNAGRTTTEPRNARRTTATLIAATLTAVLAVTTLSWVQQRKLRGDAVTNDYGYPAAAAFIAANDRPGDGIVYTGYFNLHRGFRYEWRNVPAGEQPREVLVRRPAGQEWSWLSPPCPAREAVSCLRGTERLWLVSSDPGTTTGPGDEPGGEPAPEAADIPDGAPVPGAKPLGELLPRQKAVRDRYRVVRTVAFHRLWVTELALR